MSLPVVTLDFDDVLFPFVPLVIGHFNPMFATNFTVTDMGSMRFNKLWPQLETDLFERQVQMLMASEAAHPANLPPIVGSVETLGWLKQHAEPWIVSARNEDDHAAATLDYAKFHFPEVFRGIHLMGSSLGTREWRPKSEMCLELGSRAHVDDSLYHLRDVQSVGIDVVRFGDYPWNRYRDELGNDVVPPGMYSAQTWPECQTVLARLLGVS